MSDASQITTREPDEIYKTLVASVGVGEIHQLADGRAGVFAGTSAGVSGDSEKFRTDGQYSVTKTAGIVILDGGAVYWDASANSATFKKVGDQDFFIGTAVGDAASADVLVTVNLNVAPAYLIDLANAAFTTAIVGTQALGGLALNRRGSTLNVVISATNEAQKVDALSRDTFALGANWIIESAFCVVNDGAGTVVDVSVGIASATHASDADSIAQHLFMHLDANVTKINFQSKDGTTTVAATDSTTVYTEGATLSCRKEVWIDGRDPTSVKIYVDGVRVLSATTFTVNNAASEWKLLMHVEKSASTDTYEFDLDWLRARIAEQ